MSEVLEGTERNPFLRVFINRDGWLRAGWRALLLLLLFAGLTVGFMFLLAQFVHARRHGDLPPAIALLQEAPQVAALLIAAGLLSLAERRPLLALPFGGRARLARFASGLAWGFVALSALVLLLWRAHVLVFSAAMLPVSTAIAYGVIWGVVFLLVGFLEETLFRGYLQYILASGMRFWPAALLLSALFGAAHMNNKGESHVGVFAAGVVALLLSLSVWYTGSLWWAIGFHAAWDWAESFFYGTADSGMMARGHLFSEHPIGNTLLSGGATGPEGSLYIIPLLLILLLGAWLWWRRRQPEWQVTEQPRARALTPVLSPVGEDA